MRQVVTRDDLDMESDDERDRDGRRRASKAKECGRLDMVQWMAAYDYCGLFLAATRLMSLSAVWAHKRVCLDVACELRLRLHVPLPSLGGVASSQARPIGTTSREATS